MAQMCLAAIAVHLGPAHKEASIYLFADHLCIQRLEKGWPSRATFELRILVEQWGSTADTHVGTGPLRKVFVCSSPFRPVFASDLIGQI